MALADPMVGTLNRIPDVADHSVQPGERCVLDAGMASARDDHLMFASDGLHAREAARFGRDSAAHPAACRTAPTVAILIGGPNPKIGSAGAAAPVCRQNRAYGSVQGSSRKAYPLTHLMFALIARTYTSFQSIIASPRLTAAQALRQLLKLGHKDKDLPAPGTMAKILRRPSKVDSIAIRIYASGISWLTPCNQVTLFRQVT
jgi:hypothetical protein